MAELSRFTDRKGGRFHVFGTAATGAMNHDSDFDVLVEASPEREAEAFAEVERACSEHDLPLDALAYRTMSQRFLARVRDQTIVIERPADE